MYFNIKLSWEPKVIGVRNGVYQVELDHKKYKKESLQQINEYFHSTNIWTTKDPLPCFDIHFYFKKFKMTKETNFMSFSPFLNNCLFLIDETIVEILARFNIQSYELYTSTLYDPIDEKENNNYKMFFSLIQDYDVIDFNNTEFSSGGFGNNPLTFHKFPDLEAYKSFPKLTSIVKLGLSKKFDINLDFFYTRFGGYFVSERLKLALEEHSVTGINFCNKIEVIS